MWFVLYSKAELDKINHNSYVFTYLVLQIEPQYSHMFWFGCRNVATRSAFMSFPSHTHICCCHRYTQLNEIVFFNQYVNFFLFDNMYEQYFSFKKDRASSKKYRFTFAFLLTELKINHEREKWMQQIFQVLEL